MSGATELPVSYYAGRLAAQARSLHKLADERDSKAAEYGRHLIRRRDLTPQEMAKTLSVHVSRGALLRKGARDAERAAAELSS